MAAGIGAGILGGWQRSDEEKKRAEMRKKQIEEAKDTMQLEYDLAETDALEQAGRVDDMSTKQEGVITAAYNNAINNIGEGQRMRTVQNQASLIAMDSAEGEGYAAMGGSGVRSTATSYAAAERGAAFNEKAFSRQIASQQAQEEYALYQAYAGYGQSMNEIGERRYAADKTRASYADAGGYTLSNGVQVSNGSNYQMLEQKKKEIDLNIEAVDLELELNDFWGGGDFWRGFSNVFTATVGGAASGLGFASGIYDLKQWKKPKTPKMPETPKIEA
jgi:hypothetical protein